MSLMCPTTPAISQRDKFRAAPAFPAGKNDIHKSAEPLAKGSSSSPASRVGHCDTSHKKNAMR